MQPPRTLSRIVAPPIATLVLAAVAAAQPVGPWLHRPTPPPQRPAPLPPRPTPEITTRGDDGRVVLLDAGAELAAVRAVGLDDAALARLDAAVARHHAEVNREVVDHLDYVLWRLLPTRAAAAGADPAALRGWIEAAADVRPPSLLARLEREGVVTPEERRAAQAAVDDHIRVAAEDAALAAAAGGPDAVLAARLRVEFFMATGEVHAAAQRLLLGTADRWRDVEPGLSIDPARREALAAAVRPALNPEEADETRIRAMGRGLAHLTIEEAAGAIRTALPEAFAPEPAGRFPRPLAPQK